MAEDRCKPTRLLLGALADGQLDAVKTLELEEHIAGCEDCVERLALDRAMRETLKKGVKTAMPEDVRARMLGAMAGETARGMKRDTSPPDPAGMGRLRQWRTMLPFASAAALAVAWGFAGRQPMATTGNLQVGGTDDDFLREIVAQHSRPLRPETEDRKRVRAFERDIGVPVRVLQFQKQNERFLGGRVLPVHGTERAAMLQYELGENGENKRVSVFIFDPSRVKVTGFGPARPVGTAVVQVGRSGAYSVAVTEQGGVGYAAVTSELDPETSAKLVANVNATNE